MLGPDPLASTAAGLKVSARIEGPLDLSAYGVLLAWPLGAVITYVAVAAGAEVTADDPDLEPISPVDPAEPSEPH